MKQGELHYRRGIITYSISPHEQRPYANVFTKGFLNTVRRIKSKFLIVVPRKS